MGQAARQIAALLLCCGASTWAQRATPENDIGPADPSMAVDGITLQLKPSAARQEALRHFLAAQQNPSSPEFHRWLTPEQYAERFGAASGDITRITEWLKSEGLRVDSVARGGNWIVFSGTAGQLQSALGVRMHRYRVNGERHYANTNEPSIPAALKDSVAGFRGLNDFRMKPMTRPMEKPDYDSLTGDHDLVPDDLAAIYNFGSLARSGIDGTGMTIAIVGESNVDVSDIRMFRAKYNLPPNDPKTISAGTDPGSVPSSLVEADLDIEWAGAIAPNATVIYVYARDVLSAAQYVVDNNLAPILSMSFGGCEPQGAAADNSVAQQANAQGITWLAASGDSGAASCDGLVATIPATASQGLNINEPANYPEVTGIGGSTFSEGGGTYWSATNGPNGGSALQYIPEVAWNDTAMLGMLTASGGGASSFYPKPLWQNAPGVPADGARDVPDVALAASPNHDGYEVATGGQFHIYGGTSVSTPVFAGMLALLNQSLISRGLLARPGLGNINPELYRLARTAPGVFHDITSGNNVVPCQAGSPNCDNGWFGYYAGPGYDLVTGLGSIDAGNLIAQWSIPANAASSVSASATPDPVYKRDNSWSVTIHLSETAGGATTLTGFTYADQDLSSQIPNYFGTNAIEPYDTITATVSFPNASFPATQTLGFSGRDPGGRTWTQQISVQFLGPEPAGAPTITGVGNAASFRPVFAPGTIVSVFGANLAASVTVNGIAAPLYFVSPGQINLQIPYQTPAGPATLAITSSGGTATFPLTVQANAPGIFASNGALVPYATGKRLDTLPMFITGVSAGAVSVTVGGVNAPIAYEEIASGLGGVNQINFVIPASAPLGMQAVIVTAGGTASPAVNLTITQ